MKWHVQIKNLLTKLKTRLAGLNKLKYIVPYSIRKIITQSIFTSVLVYCLPLFGGCEMFQIKELQVLQNKAGQIVTHSAPRSRRSDLFDRLDWLTVNQLIVYHTLIVVYKVRLNNTPEYLANKLKNDSRNGRIVIQNTDLSLAQKSFVIRGSNNWNSLPEHIRSQKKIGSFKKQVKTWIIDSIPRFLE